MFQNNFQLKNIKDLLRLWRRGGNRVERGVEEGEEGAEIGGCDHRDLRTARGCFSIPHSTIASR